MSIALRSEPIDGPDYREARPCHSLPPEVPSGDSLTVELDFFLDAGYETAAWRLDLVNEGLFWFSQLDTDAAAICFS